MLENEQKLMIGTRPRDGLHANMQHIANFLVEVLKSKNRTNLCRALIKTELARTGADVGVARVCRKAKITHPDQCEANPSGFRCYREFSRPKDLIAIFADTAVHLPEAAPQIGKALRQTKLNTLPCR